MWMASANVATQKPNCIAYINQITTLKTISSGWKNMTVTVRKKALNASGMQLPKELRLNMPSGYSIADNFSDKLHAQYSRIC